MITIPANRKTSVDTKTPNDAMRLVARLLVAALVVLTAACQAPEEAAAPAAEATAPVAEVTEEGPDTYVARAEIVSLPAPDADPPLLMLHHEAMPDLEGVDGAVVGMDSMQMDFRFDPALDLGGLAEGDKIEFTLAVDWFGEVPQEIVKIEKLPPETELDFEADAAEGGSGSHEDHGNHGGAGDG